jgi:uracil-DNA glycosylase family 4
MVLILFVRLNKMLKPPSCQGCPIESFSQGFILSEGEGSNGVVLLGEKGGYNEYIDALPFRPYAQGGSKLEEVFKLVQRDTGQPCTRKQFLTYNTINCCPPESVKGELEKQAVAWCSPNVDRVVGGFHTPLQKTILALGNVPLVSLTGMSGVAEEKQSVSHLRGFVFESRYGLVVSSYHPNFVKRGNNHLTPMLVEDLKRALNVAKGLYSNYPSHRDYVAPVYQTSPGLDEAWSFYYRVRDSQKLCLSYDIETNETGAIDEDERDELESTEIILVQFSISKGTGIALPWSELYLPVIMALFSLPNIKANHNTWNFDNPRLRAKGIRIEGKVHDTMWMFKHWHPRLPRGLQSIASMLGFPFPWKHLYSSRLEWYGCADVDAVQWIVAALPKLMKARGIWNGYINHVYNIHPILDRASVVGIPVSEGKRLALEVDFKIRRREIHKELQGNIPDEIRNIKPKRKLEDGTFDYGYIREPKEVGIEFSNYQRVSDKLLADGKRVIDFPTFLYKKCGIAFAEFGNVTKGAGERVERWCKIEEFKASSTQLIRYLKWKQQEIRGEAEKLRQLRQELHNGRDPDLTAKINELEELASDYEVPQNLKTKKDTTAKGELEEMFINTGDPVLERVVRIRSYDTNITNYIPNWKPSKDGRVHTTWGFTAPSGQFDARRPNILNCSKHTEFGNEFRGIIQAPKGRVFVEFDKKSFHVGTLGYCANDKSYIRFSQIDPHSILGSYIDPTIIGQSISLKWSDEDIKSAASEFKKRCKQHKAKDVLHNVDVRQELAKPTVLGNQLELGPKKLQRQNRRFIEYIYKRQRLTHGGVGLSAEELQSMIAELFPKEQQYKSQIKEKAHIEKYLINEFGRIQYFYDVFNFSYSKKMGKWTKKDGDGARDPIAFRVQSTAFGMITDELRECERQGLCEEHEFIDTIHDSLVFLPEVGKRDKCVESVFEIMNKPCGKLVNEATGPEGLKISVEVAVGGNWKGYDKQTNTEGMQEIKI